jgi:lia operon protein LiaG
MNKLLLLALTGVLATQTANAQEYRTKIGGKDRKVVLEMQGSDITVEGIGGDELVIKGNGYEEAPKRAEGLRPIYNSAVDNTKIGLAVTQTDNAVRIVRASRRDANYVIQVPKGVSVQYNQTNWNGGDLTVRDVAGSLELNVKNGDIKLTNVTGPVVANTVSGDIQVRFAPLRQGPSAISTVSGDVDVSLPSNTKATLSMRSVSGEVYTDFDLSLGKNGDDSMRHIGGQVVDGTINGGGGNVLSLKTVSGDIFVRKAK